MQITVEMCDLPKVTQGVSSTAGMLNSDLQRGLLAAKLPASLLLAPVVGADQKMDGKRSDLGLLFFFFFFIQKKDNYFSQGLLGAALTLSPQRTFWMSFACLFSHVLCGGKGRGWVDPEQSRIRLTISFSGDGNLRSS